MPTVDQKEEEDGEKKERGSKKKRRKNKSKNSSENEKEKQKQKEKQREKALGKLKKWTAHWLGVLYGFNAANFFFPSEPSDRDKVWVPPLQKPNLDIPDKGVEPQDESDIREDLAKDAIEAALTEMSGGISSVVEELEEEQPPLSPSPQVDNETPQV